MKRSEMIKLIKSELLDWDNEVVCNNHLAMAESLLTLMEEKGMLPPFGVSFEQQHISNRWGVTDFSKTETVRVIKPIWDSEID